MEPQPGRKPINRSPRTKDVETFFWSKPPAFTANHVRKKVGPSHLPRTVHPAATLLTIPPSWINIHGQHTIKVALSFVQQSMSEKHPEKKTKNSSSPNPPTPTPRYLPSEATWPSFPSAWRRRTARAWSRRPSRDRRRWRVGWAGPGWSTRTPRPEGLGAGEFTWLWLGSIYYYCLLLLVLLLYNILLLYHKILFLLLLLLLILLL